jgi:hypothetical protein
VAFCRSKGEGMSAGFRCGSRGPSAGISSGPSAGAGGSPLIEFVSVLAVRAAFISRRVVRCVVVVVEVQAPRRVTASKPAVILVIILFGLVKASGGISPDGLYNYYISRRVGKNDFCESRRIFAKRPFS